MSRRFFHFLCVFLLLVAQQGALVHATWHASGGDVHAHEAHAHDHEGDDESPTGQKTLCKFHLAFGEVLGGVNGSCALPVVVELPAAISTYTFNPRLGSEAVPAHSRGPPQHL